jgi:hypothetical protein
MRSDPVSIPQCVASPVWLERPVLEGRSPMASPTSRTQQHQSRSLTRIAGTWRISVDDTMRSSDDVMRSKDGVLHSRVPDTSLTF